MHAVLIISSFGAPLFSLGGRFRALMTPMSDSCVLESSCLLKSRRMLPNLAKDGANEDTARHTSSGCSRTNLTYRSAQLH